ncbi:MAG: hypothetical protein ACLTZI_04535 [[Eubacterium] siraeum]
MLLSSATASRSEGAICTISWATITAACASTEADLTDMICVDGDFVVFGNMKYSGKLYVNGNVYVDKSHNQGLISNQMYVGGNIYFSPGFGNMENYVKHITFVDSDGSKHTYSNLTDAKASGRVVECASAITLTLDEKATYHRP